jgi:cytochrome P450
MGYGANMAFMPHGPVWRHHRRLAQQNFRLDAMASHQPVQKRRVHYMLKGLLDAPESLFVHTRVYVSQIT